MARLRSESEFLGPRGLTTFWFWGSVLGSSRDPLPSVAKPLSTRLCFQAVAVQATGLPILLIGSRGSCSHRSCSCRLDSRQVALRGQGVTSAWGHVSMGSVGRSRRRWIGPLDRVGWPNSCARRTHVLAHDDRCCHRLKGHGQPVACGPMAGPILNFKRDPALACPRIRLRPGSYSLRELVPCLPSCIRKTMSLYRFEAR